MAATRTLTFRQRRTMRQLARELDEWCPGLGARLCPRRLWSTRTLVLSLATLAPCGTAAVLQLVRDERAGTER
jgi:hypothetical protein